MIPIPIPIPVAGDSDSDSTSSVSQKTSIPILIPIPASCVLIQIPIPTNHALIPILIPESDSGVIYNSAANNYLFAQIVLVIPQSQIMTTFWWIEKVVQYYGISSLMTLHQR